MEAEEVETFACPDCGVAVKKGRNRKFCQNCSDVRYIIGYSHKGKSNGVGC